MPRSSTTWTTESGNPAGRPKNSVTLAETARTFMAGHDENRKKARRIAFVEKLYELAMADDSVAAARLLWSYVDGLPVQKTESTVTSSPSSDPGWVALRTELLRVAKLHPEIDAVLDKALNGHSAN